MSISWEFVPDYRRYWAWITQLYYSLSFIFIPFLWSFWAHVHERATSWDAVSSLWFFIFFPLHSKNWLVLCFPDKNMKKVCKILVMQEFWEQGPDVLLGTQLLVFSGSTLQPNLFRDLVLWLCIILRCGRNVHSVTPMQSGNLALLCPNAELNIVYL